MSPNAPAIVTALGSWNLIKQMKGDPAAESWESIQIIWHGPPGAWRPETGLPAAE